MAASLVYIYNPRAKDKGFLGVLQRKYRITGVSSGKQALEQLEAALPDAIVLDSASLRTSGLRICKKLKNLYPGVPLIHVTDSAGLAQQSTADVVLADPTPRRLSNSVGRFLTHREEELLTVGPFTMNVPRRILLAHGSETQLTPKQARLVELFLRHPGQTIDRKTIMARVWETDYMGDTRTLDVHIRWVRQVLEDADTPRYLKTVRGVGYKLDLPLQLPSPSV